ncbi:other/FunK1 protein kinase [Coprinopsis cinerea okayama7|uniref:Other/FunK1 protein kinase n=1 Tax=Coprinopsis cinerea (strain Okayama-7 / 130 / ATCC MYA-4618 / FGSC 9003) TaxID=240176 RepID=D6RPM7_COPC7|nr:other/FunK1 protein kinase [Coprinopsis cinerea okayama7\|eukprot:XP_002910496.1 other/FunK1 protein kinase [Coprinopsis cinerea okayama7\
MGYEPATYHAEKFIQTHLPKDGLSNFDAIVAELEAQKVLAVCSGPVAQPAAAADRSSHTLKSFKGLFRSGYAKPTRVLKALQATWNAVRKAMTKVTQEANTKSYAIRKVDGEDALIETCLTANMDAPLRSTDVVIPFRMATGISSDNQNLPDPLPEFFRVINEDARRRHLYAITIEGADLSLWYLSRSECVKSTPFNMVERTDLLIQAFISLMSATDEKLGYDPLVTLLPDLTYVYELPPDEGRNDSLYYQTVELVSEFHSDDPVGRSARVWKVKQVVSPTDLNRVPETCDRILKDVSLDARMKPEVDIQRQLFADIAAFGKRPDWRSADVLKDMRQEDIGTLMDALDGENFKKYFSCIIASHVGKPYSCPARSQSQSLPFGDGPSPTYVPKRQCFYLYEFICTPLYDIPTLGEAIDVLRQCLTAMRLMYCAGWIHRDISVGNILAIRSGPEAPWEMKLSDLEFARKFLDPEIQKDEKPIGTPFFMACELQAGTPILPDEIPASDYELDSSPESEDWEPSGPILHNFQHEIESMWWIILWLLTARVRGSAWHEFSKHFFRHSNSTWYGRARRMLLTSRDPLDSEETFPKDLPRGLHAKPLSFIRCLHAFKLDLWRSYTLRFSAKGQKDPGSYSWIVGKGASKFFIGIERSREAWAAIRLIVQTEARQVRAPMSKKRKAEVMVAVPNVVSPPPVVEQRKEKQPHRPRKRLRLTAPDSATQHHQRSGPVTRSMTREQRNAGPTTRSMTRRLQQSAPGSSRLTRSSDRRART